MSTKTQTIEELSIPDFIRQYHQGLTYQAIKYALVEGIIDGHYEKKGWRVKLTPTTMKYSPIRSTRRARKTNTTT